MKRTRYNLVNIDKSDNMGDMPDQWNKNNEAIAEALDKVEAEVARLREDIECLRRLYYSP